MIKRKIKRGNHYSTIIPRIKLGRTIGGTVKFIGNFAYDIGEKQSDTNKVIGLSDNWHHHKDSVRIGFRFNKKLLKYQAMAIVYENGFRTICYLCEFMTNKEYKFEIRITKNSYQVWFNGKHAIFDRTSKWFGPRVILQPYFGGTEVAPKDFKFEFNLL